MNDPTFQFFQSPHDTAPPLRVPNMGLELTVRLPGSATGSTLEIIETSNAPGFGPPLHRHRETEIFRVLEGRYLYEVDGRRFEAVTGDLVSVPGGAAHAFINLTDHPARQLIVLAPAMDAARFFTELAAVFAAGRPDRATLSRFGEPWGVEFLGPPLTIPPAPAP